MSAGRLFIVRVANRAMRAGVASAIPVRTNGFRSRLAKHDRIAAPNRAVLRCEPRRTHRSIASANNRSTKFSQDGYVGMKSAWNRRRLTSQFLTTGVWCVPELFMTTRTSGSAPGSSAVWPDKV